MTITYETAEKIMDAIAFTLVNLNADYEDDIEALNADTRTMFCDYCNAEEIDRIEKAVA